MKIQKVFAVGTVFCVFTILVIITAGAAINSDSDRTVEGKDVYRINCAGCHGENLSGNPPQYPSLKDTGKEFSESELKEIIKNGKGEMPAFPHLTTKQIEVVTKYLRKGISESVNISTPEMGEGLFKSNCVSCHQIEDKSFARRCMMNPGSLREISKGYTKERFFGILENGPCYMPSFNHFTGDEKKALYTFVTSTGEETESATGSGKNDRDFTGDTGRRRSCCCR